jgi:hypothetical protein
MKVFRAFGFSLLLLIFSNGCANVAVTLQSNKDAAAVHYVRRLYVLVNLGEFEKQPLSKNASCQMHAGVLADSLRESLTNTTVQAEIQVVNPLELNPGIYDQQIRAFHADGVLMVKLRQFVVNQFGGCPTVNFDATLLDELTHKYEWRATINNSGDPEAMDERLKKMGSAIVAQLRTDGFLETP